LQYFRALNFYVSCAVVAAKIAAVKIVMDTRGVKFESDIATNQGKNGTKSAIAALLASRQASQNPQNS